MLTVLVSRNTIPLLGTDCISPPPTPMAQLRTPTLLLLAHARKAAAIIVLCATAIASPAQTFTTLANFDGTNGASPQYMTLVQGTNGNYYGTTSQGGTYGYGTVFEITPSGVLITLYSFCAQSTCPDGAYPYAGLVQGTNGTFYGTTSGGGANGNYGTVFKITAGGTLTTLHSFNGTDGQTPYGTLLQANGGFYGTTFGGGPYGNYGTIFKITAAGAFSTLYNFCTLRGCADGNWPAAGLIQATDGSFYGTTTLGDINPYGSVFKITPAGELTTLYYFCTQGGGGCPYDGAYPYGALVQASNGSFYGTTSYGGTYVDGTVFKITPVGKLTTLHSFDAPSDGQFLYGALVQATDGNFYGTTSNDGPNGFGTVFEITPAGMLTTLRAFGKTDGAYLYGGLLQATNGTFYGVTSAGGSTNQGTVFSLSVGLGPFVETRPIGAKVGAKVIILGNNLTGTTSVTFNGIAATFTVVSSSEITTRVPTGATTGTVEVTTPSGTLESNVAFRVP
jgi:uncharacterized repeat protein (TIGR03803 family)